MANATYNTNTFWAVNLQPVVGRRVTSADMVLLDEDDEDYEPAWAPRLTFDNGDELIILMDEEGNAGGRYWLLDRHGKSRERSIDWSDDLS